MKTEFYHEPTMDTTASEIGGIFRQVHGAQPLHHAMIGPLLNLWRGDAILWEQTTTQSFRHWLWGSKY